MQVLKQFSIPLKGLKIGHHDYAYHFGKEFFSAFDNAPFSKGEFDSQIQLEKKSDHLIVLIRFSGHFLTECDRCTDEIPFPLSGNYEMIVKYDVDEREEEDVMYIQPDSSEFNLAKLIHDGVFLSMPLYKTCEAVEGKECDQDVLDRFISAAPETKEEGNALAEALKNLKLK